MGLNDLLIEKKASILQKWFDAIIESYPADASNFLKEQKNQFTNPVGTTISKGIENILDELLSGLKSENISKFLDEIVRIRAVQDFTPASALSFIFLLKKVIREDMEKDIQEKQLYGELLAFESKIDDLACAAFDIYMKCREKIYEIKANEVKSMTFRLLQRANLICEIPDQETDLKANNNSNIKER